MRVLFYSDFDVSYTCKSYILAIRIISVVLPQKMQQFVLICFAHGDGAQTIIKHHNTAIRQT